MKQIKYILLMVLCALGITSCQDDWMENEAGAADVNRPVKTTLTFGVPRSTEIAVTRANNDNSDVYSVRIYVFSGGKFLRAQTIANGELQEREDNNPDEQGRHYTAQNVTLYSGTQTVYALGNLTRSGYFDANEPTELIQRLDAAAEQGETAFLAVLYDLPAETINGQTFPRLTTDYAPLSGKGEITVTDRGASGTVELRRILTEIKFEIAQTYTKTVGREQHKVTFTPLTYTFYNIPKKAYIMGGDNNQSEVEGEAYFYHSASVPIDAEGQFSVFLPENIQKAKQTVTTYDLREAFGEQHGDVKEWKYAPSYGTYVLLKGQYAETIEGGEQDGKLVKYADTEYTIHLGDFSDLRSTESLSDFSVERNCIYTYKVSVTGVDKIITEATKENLTDEDKQNGAEGDVIELTTGSEVFNLDAHYEQVYVSYNLSEIARGIEMVSGSSEDDIKQRVAENFRLSIHTPFNTRAVNEEVIMPYNNPATEEEGMKGIDHEWIKFYSLRQNDPQLMSYEETTDETLLSPWNVCQKLGDAVYQLYNNPSSEPSVEDLHIIREGNQYYARFTIFIDEYFYQKDLGGRVVAWDSFTNQEPRTLLIASDMQTSDDKNSTYSIALTYISQASIQTFYNPAAASYYNAMGLESYNENGIIVGFGNAQAPENEYDDGKGRANTLYNIAGTENIDNMRIPWAGGRVGGYYGTNYPEFVNWNEVGYTRDNTVSGNIITGLPTSNSAYYACLSRNRDLDRDGIIDDSEVRWYLPALSQYLRIGIGTEALSADARLYTGRKSEITSSSYPKDEVSKGALYFVSNANKNYYWAVEMGAYGSYTQPYIGYGGQIRCVRNLPNKKMVEAAGNNAPSVGKDAWAGPVYGALTYIGSGNRQNYVFSFGDRLISSIFRSQVQTTPYSAHTEMDEENFLPAAFVVSRNYVNNNDYPGTHAQNPQNDPCKNYHETNRGGYDDYWRTPNLSELMVMTTQAETLNMNHTTLCSTSFSNDVRLGFVFQFRNSFDNPSTMITAGDNSSTIPNGRIRCVRDASPAEIEEAERNMPPLEESTGN